MRVWRVLLIFGVMYLPPAAVLASEDLALPRLPAEEFHLIPGNAGMRFFEGVWRPIAGDSYRITKTVTVTDKTITLDDIDKVSPYRVLAERENYVLLASYDRVGVIEFEYDYWTRFVILHLKRFDIASELPPEQADMAYNYCADYRLKNGEKGFLLPKAELLRIFGTSLCLKDTLSYFKINNRSRGVIAWGGEIFTRNDDAKRGMGWIRMWRNKKILGLPQGTVPEPKN